MTMPRARAAATLFLVLGLGLTGCGSSAPAAAPGSADSSEADAPTPTPEPAPDLTGEWKQTNSQDEDSYQAATITADTIDIFWVSNGGDTKSLYWAGTFEAPTESGTYSWDSVNDTEQTDVAMLASGDPTKTFSYDDGEISYEVSLMGTTTTVRIEK